MKNASSDNASTTVVPGHFSHSDPLLTDKEAEALLRMGRGFLAKDRCGKARIKFVKIGRSVRYRRSAILNFIEASTRASTSDAGKAA